jgi:hypothetical protein
MRELDARLALDVSLVAIQAWTPEPTDLDPDDGVHVVPGELRRFLARLRLLYGVPFSYLVPDADLLPKESIRFFYVDRAWTDALVQGALSVGTVSTADRAQLEAVHQAIRDDVDDAEAQVRQPLEEDLLAGSGDTITGFLLRSRAVSGWPNLHVRAYRRDLLEDDELTTKAESDPDRMKVLRLERLAPAVLLVLIDGVPEVVHIEEPRQGIQFGVTLDPQDPPGAKTAKVHLRGKDGMPVLPKDHLTDTNSVPVPFRPGAPGVLDIRELRKRIKAEAPPEIGDVDSKEFAMEMLQFPFRQVFGDPDDKDHLKFYDLDAFKLSTTTMVAWKSKLEAL